MILDQYINSVINMTHICDDNLALYSLADNQQHATSVANTVAKPHNWATFDPVLRATNCVLQIAEPITVNGTAGKHANFPRNGINISLHYCKISLQECKLSKYFLCISLFQRQQYSSKW